MARDAATRSGERLSVAAAARLLGVSVSSLRAWAADDLVPHERTPGGHRRFDREQLREWMAQRGGDLPAQPSGRGPTLVAGRVECLPDAARVLTDEGGSIVDEALALMADGQQVSHRRTTARRARMDDQLADLADALDAGDLSGCLREAEWQAYRHGAAGLPATQPVGEWLALACSVERHLHAVGLPHHEVDAVRQAMDRLSWRAAAGLAAGRRSRAEAREDSHRAA